jgi:hypothetical protein
MLSAFQYRLTSLFLFVGLAGLACWLLMNVVVPLALVGSIRDLPPEELKAIEYLRHRGIAVGDTLGRCSFAIQMRPIVRWQDGGYRVVAVDLSGTPPTRMVIEDLGRFTTLSKARVAASNEQIQQLQASYPDFRIEQLSQ